MHFVNGEYVISECTNMLNGDFRKKSYWISKKYCTDAYYCFSARSHEEAKKMLAKDSWASYIELFETRHLTPRKGDKSRR